MRAIAMPSSITRIRAMVHLARDPNGQCRQYALPPAARYDTARWALEESMGREAGADYP